MNIREKEELVAAPDHIHNCEACGQSPVVQFANKEGKLVYNSGICGSCYFGTGEMLNPENW